LPPQWWQHVGLWPQSGANQALIVGRKHLHDVPNGPVLAIPDEITTTGHILCAAEGQHKECPSRVGTVAQPLCVQFKSP
jgi:hypothetical protein